MGGQVGSLKRDIFACDSFDTFLDSYKHIDNKSEKPKNENFEIP
jgi:hypothetical protein